jgi:hypothetical protein
MQKNEVDILDYWLRYHSAIFGASSIILIDASNDPVVISVIQKWKAKGVIVIPAINENYRRKGDLSLKAFRKYNPYADLFWPIDIDEFIVAFDGDTPIFNVSLIRKNIMEAWSFSKHTTSFGVLPYFPSTITNLTETVETIQYFHKFFYNNHVCKKFAKGNAVKKLDHGNHQLTTKFGAIIYLKNIGYLHYHFRSPLSVVLKAINDCIGFGYLKDGTNITSLVDEKHNLFGLIERNAVGKHKVGELLTFLDHVFSGFINSNPTANTVKVDLIAEYVNSIEQQILEEKKTNAGSVKKKNMNRRREVQLYKNILL